MEIKGQRLVEEFEKRLNNEGLKSEVARVANDYDLNASNANIQFSVFDLGIPKLSFNPTKQQFQEIIKNKKPKEIYYKEVNADDVGIWGSMCIKPTQDIEIYSSQYISGYLGVWDQICKLLGYVDEERTTGFKNHSGKFVLK